MLSSSLSGISLIAVIVFLFAGMRPVDATSVAVVVDDANTAQVTYSESNDFKDCTCLVTPSQIESNNFGDCACLLTPTLARVRASAHNGTFHPCVW
jgi:archaellin